MRRAWSVATVVVVAMAAAATAAAQTDPAEYLTTITDLQVRMDTIGLQGEDVNASWDARNVTFEDTLDAFRSIEAEASGVVDAVRLLTPPEEFGPQHAALITTAEESLAAASAMIAGLNANDSGEARQAAVDQFLSATGEFSSIALLIVAPSTTTTTTPAAATTTSTTTTAATTVTTTAPVTAALPTGTDSPDDSGGSDLASPLLIVIGLIAGLLLGLVGGLLIGRQARHRLVVALQRERAGGAPPPS